MFIAIFEFSMKMRTRKPGIDQVVHKIAFNDFEIIIR